jgi:hypothetical protein
LYAAGDQTPPDGLLAFHEEYENAVLAARRPSGGVWSPAAYKIFINSLLTTYETEKLGARIGSIFCGVPTVVDDVTLVSFDPFELQTMLDTQMSRPPCLS